MKRYLALLLTIICVTISGYAQEMNMRVSISTPQLQQTDPQIFKRLEGDLQEFINTQIWTSDEFLEEEKIESSITIIIREELSNNTFIADLMISSARPIYNSDYKTQLINYQDKSVEFQYDEYGELKYSEGSFTSDLVSIISFYVYYIIGADYDSFAPLGGSKYYKKAEEIMNNLPPDRLLSVDGWSSRDKAKSRYWMVENATSSKMVNFRHALYQYHRLGLDAMSENPDEGINVVFEALGKVESTYISYPDAVVLDMFSKAKFDEIEELFKPADMSTKNRVDNIMLKMDPAGFGNIKSRRKGK